jgi:hypothetical protein
MPPLMTTLEPTPTMVLLEPAIRLGIDTLAVTRMI